MVIACSFHKAYAPDMGAQQEVHRRLADAQPAGMAFASVDIKAAPAVADWAGVREPEVRLLHPDGSVVERMTPKEVKAGALQRFALSKAKQLAAAAEEKLSALSRRFPNALHGKLGICLPHDDPAKMQKHAKEVIQKVYGSSSPEEEMVEALCRSCQQGSSARARSVACLARTIRAAESSELLPFLDMARRLAALKLLGGSEPGALESLELLLDASLCRVDGVDRLSLSPGPALMLALQLLANCFHQAPIAEALLPVVSRLLQGPALQDLWSNGSNGSGGSHVDKAREAAATVLLNASVVLREARLRAAHAPLLQHCTLALRCCPGDDRLNWAAANLLGVGGGEDEAKAVLQAQPQAPLRLLAAAIFNDQLSGPDNVAFPAVWHPGGPARQETQEAVPEEEQRRRPARGAIPARYRGRRGGG